MIVIPGFVQENDFKSYLFQLIDNALAEDIGSGDHTSRSTIPDNLEVTAKLLVKDEGIIAGIDLAEIIFKRFDPGVLIEKLKKDGDPVSFGEIAFYVRGKAQSVFTCERLVLNFMQHLSGIATKTRHLCEMIKDYHTILLDTRKTTPGLRLLEKWAVSIGGAQNHRIGLYDMILVKDNHVDYAGGISNAVKRVKEYLHQNNLDLKIEVEVRNFEELNELLTFEGIERVLLDNFSPAQITEAINIISGKIKTEASGGIKESNIVEYAKTGIDYISTGAVTNSVRSLDLSLKIVRN